LVVGGSRGTGLPGEEGGLSSSSEGGRGAEGVEVRAGGVARSVVEGVEPGRGREGEELSESPSAFSHISRTCLGSASQIRSSYPDLYFSANSSMNMLYMAVSMFLEMR